MSVCSFVSISDVWLITCKCG